MQWKCQLQRSLAIRKRNPVIQVAKQWHGQRRPEQGMPDGAPFHPLNNSMCPTYPGSISQSEKRFSGGLDWTTRPHSLHTQANPSHVLHVRFGDKTMARPAAIFSLFNMHVSDETVINETNVIFLDLTSCCCCTHNQRSLQSIVCEGQNTIRVF